MRSSAGLQLLAACRAFTVAGPKVWNVLPEGTSAFAFHTVIYADII